MQERGAIMLHEVCRRALRPGWADAEGDRSLRAIASMGTAASMRHVSAPSAISVPTHPLYASCSGTPGISSSVLLHLDAQYSTQHATARFGSVAASARMYLRRLKSRRSEKPGVMTVPSTGGTW